MGWAGEKKEGEKELNTMNFCSIEIVARFNKHRIPRENMLMRFSKVSKEGVYTKPPHAKVSKKITKARPDSVFFTFLWD